MSRDFLAYLESKAFYQIVASAYSGKVARRSGVEYIRHIREGALVLHELFEADDVLLEAYCLHPLFQNDKSLGRLAMDQVTLGQLNPQAVLFSMEYRRVANAYTISHKVRSQADIHLGPLEPVRRMLVADKIQNKKDFMKYMYAAHNRPRYRGVAERSVAYFDSWLERLGVDSGLYGEMAARIDRLENPAASLLVTLQANDYEKIELTLHVSSDSCWAKFRAMLDGTSEGYEVGLQQ